MHQSVDIRIVSTAGFCFGVKKAYQKALETVKQNPNSKIATIGPLIHNPQVVRQLEKEGILVLNSLKEFNKGDILIVRSHGMPPESLKKAVERGIKIVDATCPYVKKLQKDALRLRSEGYFIVLVGDENHPEIKGVQGALNNSYVVIKDLSELKNIDLPDKIAFLAQTTQNVSVFDEVVQFGLSQSKNARVFNTICDSTAMRQQKTQELASEVDMMVIVGGRISANTNRLLNLSKKIQPHSFLVEIADELDAEWLKPKIKQIGISAGASTPGWIIEEVVAKIRELLDN